MNNDCLIYHFNWNLPEKAEIKFARVELTGLILEPVRNGWRGLALKWWSSPGSLPRDSVWNRRFHDQNRITSKLLVLDVWCLRWSFLILKGASFGIRGKMINSPTSEIKKIFFLKIKLEISSLRQSCRVCNYKQLCRRRKISIYSR